MFSPFAGRVPLFVGLVAALLCTGFPGRVATASQGSCDVHAVLGFCYEYAGESYTPHGAREDCASTPDGVFATSPCPDENVLATCVFDPEGDKGFRMIYSFYADAFNLKTAKMSCPGSFEPR